MRVQCGTTFKICATTFMLGIITRLSFTQEYRIFDYEQVDNIKEAGPWCCLRQMASAAWEFALFSVLDIWRKFVGDLHWRQAQSCLTAWVESPYPASNSSHKEGSEQLCSKIFWPRHPGDPLGPPQTPPVPLRIPPGFRQHCWWKCTSTASHTWHGGFCSLEIRAHIKVTKEGGGKSGTGWWWWKKERIIIFWDDSLLDKDCPQKQHFLKQSLKACLESLP